jgi:PAS domain S-box-containing protein
MPHLLPLRLAAPTLETLFKAGLALTSALLIAALAWWTWWDFVDARRDAEAKVAAAAMVVKGYAARSLAAIDFVLESATELVEGEGFADLRPDTQWQELRHVARHLPATAQLFVLDQAGHRLAATPIYPGPITESGNREWFGELKETKGEPYLGRATKGGGSIHSLFFPAARAVRGTDGAFKGAVQIGVEVDYLAELFHDLDLGPGAEVKLYRAHDGAVIAGYPATEALLNETVAAEPFFAALKSAKHSTGWVQSHGGDRLLAARRTNEAPIIAAVSVPRSAVYADAWARTLWRGLAAGTFGAALFVLTGLAVRQARAEESFRGRLTASEMRFREMANHAPVMVWLTEPDESCSFLSRSWYEFTGQTSATGLGCGWIDAVHSDDRGMIEEMVRTRRERREAFRVEYRLRRHDGVYKWVTDAAGPRFGHDGGFLGYIGSVIDISERKEAELALAERNAQLELAGKAARVGGWILAVAQNRIQITEGYAAIYQLPVGTKEISVDEWRATVHPEDVKRLDVGRAQSFAERQRERLSEYRIVCRNGAVRWIESRGFVTYDSAGRPQRMVGVSIDITERKEAELALAERNAQLALATKAARVGGYILDIASNRLQVSEGYVAIYQLPAGTAEIGADQWRAAVHPDDVERVDKLRAQSFARHESERLSEYRIVRPDRAVRWIEARSLVLYDNRGQPQRMVGVNIDVTEHKQAEQRQNALIAELDHRVKNVLAKIVALVERTRDTCGSMDEFGTAISGRIRSMANAHTLLSQSRWQGVAVAALVRQELAPYESGHNTMIEGPNVRLVAEASQAVTTVLHELATNAAKYGALSAPAGEVAVRWHFADGPAGRPGLIITWAERGGPPVAPPRRAGFGSRVIRGTISHQLGGHVDLTFAAAGVSCTIELPSERIDQGL